MSQQEEHHGNDQPDAMTHAPIPESTHSAEPPPADNTGVETSEPASLHRSPKSPLRTIVRTSAYTTLAMASLVVAFLAYAIATDFDLRFEGERERAIREYASAHRATELRFPGASHQVIRSGDTRNTDFDFSSSELSFVEQDIDADLERNPGNDQLLTLRAQIHLLRLQPAAAIDILDRLRPFSPKDPTLLGWLGYAHYLRGRSEREPRDMLRAIDFFESALTVDGQNPVLLFNAAVAYQRIGNRTAAERCFSALVALGKRDGWTREAEVRRMELTKDKP